MLNLNVNGKRGSYLVNLPTKLEEIPIDYLKDVTAGVHVADNYSLVALVYNEKLAIVLNASRKNSQLTTGCIPIFVKAGKTDSPFINSIPEGTPIVAVGTVLARGIHITAKSNKLTMNYIASICDGDKELGKNVFTMQSPVYFVEFKLIPNCDINGYYDKDEKDAVSEYVIPAPTTTTLN
jgi:hypothetical protein